MGSDHIPHITKFQNDKKHGVRAGLLTAPFGNVQPNVSALVIAWVAIPAVPAARLWLASRSALPAVCVRVRACARPPSPPPPRGGGEGHDDRDDMKKVQQTGLIISLVGRMQGSEDLRGRSAQISVSLRWCRRQSLPAEPGGSACCHWERLQNAVQPPGSRAHRSA